MTKGIKAVPTIYKGTEYKSKLEAVVAQAFDRMGLEYEYEPRIFINDAYANVSRGVHQYKPDFHLPECNAWVEVAGRWDKRHQRNAQVFMFDQQCYGWNKSWYDTLRLGVGYHRDHKAGDIDGTSWRTVPRYIVIADDTTHSRKYMLFHEEYHKSSPTAFSLIPSLKLVECPVCGKKYFWDPYDYSGCPNCDSWVSKSQAIDHDMGLEETLLQLKFGDDWKKRIEEEESAIAKERAEAEPKWELALEAFSGTNNDSYDFLGFTEVRRDDGRRILISSPYPQICQSLREGGEDRKALEAAVGKTFGSRELVFVEQGEVAEEW